MGKNCLILLVFMGLFGCSASEDEQGGILNVPEWAVGNWKHNNGILL